MSNDRFENLRSNPAPASDDMAKAKALGLAMAAFDEEQAKKTSTATQGSESGERPKGIFNLIQGLFKMDARIPVAATLSALLILPLGVMLMQSSSFTPPQANLPLPLAEPETGLDETVQSGGRAEAQDADDGSSVQTQQPPMASEEVDREFNASPPPGEVVRDQLGQIAASPESILMDAPAEPRTRISSDTLSTAPAPSPQPTMKIEGFTADGMIAPFETGGDQFAEFEDAAVTTVADAPVSTFSVDVDSASYSYMRRALNEGRLPDPASVRVEELINYFNYDYAVPTDPASPFATDIQVMPSPWDEGKQVIRIGLQGFEPAPAARKPVNLVFLIDTSGSMDASDKLPLLKSAFRLLIDQLDADDTISIVTYAGSAGTVLEPTSASERREILNALDHLNPGGSTAGAAGIEVAYQWAEEGERDGVTSRVILATDGDFNVGLSSPDALTDLIEDKRDAGIFLSVLGFGTGNLNDAVMQALAQNGNGTAHYIDSFREAQRVLVDEVGATLMPIASDVKVQVEFNPAEVAEYRLIGYETRALNREDFNNDRVDAGDVGAGLSVTALYEITQVGSDSLLTDPLRYGDQEETVAASGGEGELAFFKLRYKLPGEADSELYTQPITPDLAVDTIAEADDNSRFALAVAAFGQKLRQTVSADTVSFAEIRELASGAQGEDEAGYRREFISLVDLATSLSDE